MPEPTSTETMVIAIEPDNRIDNITSFNSPNIDTSSLPKLSNEQCRQKLLDPQAIAQEHDPHGFYLMKTDCINANLDVTQEQRSLQEKNNKKEELETSLKSNHDKTQKLNGDIEERKQKFMVRLKRLFGMNDKQLQQYENQLTAAQQASLSLSDQLGVLDQEVTSLESQLATLRKPEQIKEEFNEKMKRIPMSNAEKRAYLTADFLSTLTTEEYIALWRRMNPQFLTHVTRQGIRDHTSDFHYKGANEFHNGFINIIQGDKLLHTPHYLAGLKDSSEESVENWLQQQGVLAAKDSEQAQNYFKSLLQHPMFQVSTFADHSAVHFCSQMVGDSLYGSETGNEIFFVYPTDVLASQRQFYFNMKADFVEPPPPWESKWNDVFVWPTEDEDEGVSIDAGIVFIPSSVIVDPETGSRYIANGTDNINKDQKIWKLVENGVPAQKYWESFFEKHPEQRPKHIIYYDGTPTDAVKHLLTQQDIGDPDTTPPEGKLLGFDDNLIVNSTDERVNIGKQEVIVTANKIIQRSFS